MVGHVHLCGVSTTEHPRELEILSDLAISNNIRRNQFQTGWYLLCICLGGTRSASSPPTRSRTCLHSSFYTSAKSLIPTTVQDLEDPSGQMHS